NDVEIAQIGDPEVTTYDDNDLAPGDFTYTVTALYAGGESVASNEVDVNIVSNGDQPIPPIVTQLIGNAPNPFNPDTTILFSVEMGETAQLTIYNSRGRIVRRFEGLGGGVHRLTWDGRDESRIPCSSGVYYCRLKTSSAEQTRKMLLLK
ncbi:MAG: T9SS type A sorting domain-containing protein, partial [Candidatus Cloacimonetes bacterium]|nr:T9SS type A sorting domain-containing protein [Candidatus Cloacimonadota bacterium]